MKKNNLIVAIVLFGLATFFSGVSFFVWTFAPYFQMMRYVSFMEKDSNISHVLEQENIFSPYSYAQPELRSSLVKNMTVAFENRLVGEDLVIAAIDRLDDAILKEPGYVKYYYPIVRAYTAMAVRNPVRRTEFLEKAEKYCKKAYVIIPENPEIAHIYSTVLVNQGRYDDARHILEQSLEQIDIPGTHYHLGITLFKSGEMNYDEALDQFSQSDVNQDSELSLSVYKKLFVHFYRTNDISRFLGVTIKLKVLDAARRDFYQQIESYVSRTNKLPVIAIQ